MPLPFEKIFKRPGFRRIILPFTLGLALLAFAFFALVGA